MPPAASRSESDALGRTHSLCVPRQLTTCGNSRSVACFATSTRHRRCSCTAGGHLRQSNTHAYRSQSIAERSGVCCLLQITRPNTGRRPVCRAFRCCSMQQPVPRNTAARAISQHSKAIDRALLWGVCPGCGGEEWRAGLAAKLRAAIVRHYSSPCCHMLSCTQPCAPCPSACSLPSWPQLCRSLPSLCSHNTRDASRNEYGTSRVVATTHRPFPGSGLRSCT
jgi:hypothetical protein